MANRKGVFSDRLGQTLGLNEKVSTYFDYLGKRWYSTSLTSVSHHLDNYETKLLLPWEFIT